MIVDEKIENYVQNMNTYVICGVKPSSSRYELSEFFILDQSTT